MYEELRALFPSLKSH